MKTRVISGVVLAVVITVLFVLGGPTLLTALFLLSLAAIYEFCNALSRPVPQADGSKMASYHPMMYMAMGATFVWYLLLLIKPGAYTTSTAALVFFSLYSMTLMMICVFGYPKFRFSDAALTLFVFVYTAVLFTFIYYLRAAQNGMFLVWYVVWTSWGCDTFSYFVGMIFGKHKLAPQLSPKKTWEGAAGGVIGSIVLCVIYGLIIAKAVNIDSAIMLKISLLVGVCASIVSICGDLFASSVKRFTKIKDYSHLIPGHGGILDRFDSMLFAAPVVVLLMELFGLI